MPSPRVAIILLNWNNTADTVACIASLAHSSYRAFQIVVVDNGSTAAEYQSLVTECPDEVILRQERNLGFAGGCNVGIRWALRQGFDYVWLLNNDTTVDPECLTEMLSVAEQTERIGMVGSMLYFSNRPHVIQSAGGRIVLDGRVRRGTSWGLEEEDRGQYNSLREVDYIPGGILLVKTRAIRDIGLLDERFFMYYEDADWGLRARKAGWRVVVAHTARVFHKDKASSGDKKPYFIKHAYFMFLYKNFPRELPHAIRLYARHNMRPHLERREWRLAWADALVYVRFLSRLAFVRPNLQP